MTAEEFVEACTEHGLTFTGAVKAELVRLVELGLEPPEIRQKIVDFHLSRALEGAREA